jgi:hypothetical protein
MIIPFDESLKIRRHNQKQITSIAKAILLLGAREAATLLDFDQPQFPS